MALVTLVSTKEVTFGNRSKSRMISGKVKLTIETIHPVGNGEVENLVIYGKWTPENDNGNTLRDLSKDNQPYSAQEIEAIEQNLPLLEDDQFIFRNLTKRIQDFIFALIDYEHQQDNQANFGLTSADLEIKTIEQ